MARAARLGERLLAGFRKLESLPAVLEARGCWLMAALELDVDDAGERADRICAGGVIVRATGQQLLLSPPFVIEDDDLDRLVEVIGHKLARPPAKAAA